MSHEFWLHGAVDGIGDKLADFLGIPFTAPILPPNTFTPTLTRQQDGIQISMQYNADIARTYTPAPVKFRERRRS